jgi:hypothetical protein
MIFKKKTAPKKNFLFLFQQKQSIGVIVIQVLLPDKEICFVPSFEKNSMSVSKKSKILFSLICPSQNSCGATSL